MMIKPPANNRQPKAERREPTAARSFTLTELLVAMGIIAIIAGVTAISVRTIARDAKLSSANNTIAAALDTARGIAIRDNRLTAVVFRPRVEGNRQFVEIVTAQWTGESPVLFRAEFESGGVGDRVIDRFVSVPGIASRRLPSGIKVAGPMYGTSDDDEWATQTHFVAPGEQPGGIVGVMFSGRGTIVMRNAVNKSHAMFIDFNNDGLLQLKEDIEYDIGNPPPAGSLVTYSSAVHSSFFDHESIDDEPLVSLVPFLAVYDDEAARDFGNPAAWGNEDDYADDLVGPNGYIANHADRIHFNRYTGVVMR